MKLEVFIDDSYDYVIIDVDRVTQELENPNASDSSTYEYHRPLCSVVISKKSIEAFARVVGTIASVAESTKRSRKKRT